MSNWQYANQVPTKQFRSANSIPRDLNIFTDGGETYLASKPSPEMDALRKSSGAKKAKKPTETCEIVIDLKGSASVVLSNSKGETVTMAYDEGQRTLTMDRSKSGLSDFSEAFAAETVGPTHGVIRQLRIFIDRSSIELFDAEGKIVMTNLVFPTEPYNNIKVKGGKATIYEIKN
jgi:levanase/fructan beta-fructosidase